MAFDSASQRRAAFREEMTKAQERRLDELARKRQERKERVINSVKVEPRPAPPPAPVMLPHQHTRNNTPLVNWNDPEDLAYVHSPAGGSDVFTGQRNMIDAVLEHERALREQRPAFERKCEQDEARIRRCTGTGPVCNSVRDAWWPSVQTEQP